VKYVKTHFGHAVSSTVTPYCRGKGYVYNNVLPKDFTKNCGYDVAGETFKHIFGSVQPADIYPA